MNHKHARKQQEGACFSTARETTPSHAHVYVYRGPLTAEGFADSAGTSLSVLSALSAPCLSWHIGLVIQNDCKSKSSLLAAMGPQKHACWGGTSSLRPELQLAASAICVGLLTPAARRHPSLQARGRWPDLRRMETRSRSSRSTGTHHSKQRPHRPKQRAGGSGSTLLRPPRAHSRAVEHRLTGV